MANEEQKVETTETENPYVNEDKQPSDVTTDASNEAGDEGKGTGEKVIPLEETEKFKKAVQVEKDKALATISLNSQKEIRKLRAEMESAKQDLLEKEDSLQWQGRQQAESQKWVESGMVEDAVRAFQQRENALRAAISSQRRKESDFTPKIQLAESYEAILSVLPDVLGDKGDLVQELIGAVSEGETLKEKTALAKLKALELKSKVAQPVEKTHRPSTGQPTGAGKGKPLTAADVSKMSPTERWERRAEIAKIPLAL